MSLVAIALQGLLSLLLVAALAYGVRLERKLRELRDGQAGFARAVGELDQAAARAEAGLRSLRESTEVAREELADRIDTARGLTARLEAAASDAAIAVKRLESARASGGAFTSPSATGRWREAPEGPRESAEAASRRSPSDRFAIGPSNPPSHLPSDAGEEKARATARRPRTDEDLFLDRDAPPATPADRLRQVADLLRGPTPAAAGGRR